MRWRVRASGSTGSGCDAWILHTGTDDALSAAAGWNRTAGSPEERAREDRPLARVLPQ